MKIVLSLSLALPTYHQGGEWRVKKQTKWIPNIFFPWQKLKNMNFTIKSHFCWQCKHWEIRRKKTSLSLLLHTYISFRAYECISFFLSLSVCLSSRFSIFNDEIILVVGQKKANKDTFFVITLRLSFFYSWSFSPERSESESFDKVSNIDDQNSVNAFF